MVVCAEQQSWNWNAFQPGICCCFITLRVSLIVCLLLNLSKTHQETFQEQYFANKNTINNATDRRTHSTKIPSFHGFFYLPPTHRDKEILMA